MPVMAVDIGDYNPLSPTSGTIEISDLNQESFFDVQVELSGRSINPVLEQIDENLIRITIEDPQISQAEIIIKVNVVSPAGEKTRFFSYHNNDSITHLSNEDQAKATLEEMDENAQTTVIVPVSTPVENDQNPGEFKDGVLHININHAQSSVGTAITQLAKANHLNVLLLPGDEQIHNVKLVSAVTKFGDLFVASNQAVKQVVIDRKRKLVRILGHVESNQDDSALSPSSPDTMSIGELLKLVAAVEGYKALIYPGKDTNLLNILVQPDNIETIETLALLIGANGGMLEIDRHNKLIRARNSS